MLCKSRHLLKGFLPYYLSFSELSILCFKYLGKARFNTCMSKTLHGWSNVLVRFYQLSSNLAISRKGNLNWGIGSIRLACSPDFEAFPWLIIDVSILMWEVLPLRSWSWDISQRQIDMSLAAGQQVGSAILSTPCPPGLVSISAFHSNVENTETPDL